MWRVVNFRSFLLVLLCTISTIISFSFFVQWLKVLSIALILTALLIYGIVRFLEKDYVKALAFAIALFFSIGTLTALVVSTNTNSKGLTDGTNYEFKGKIEKLVGNSNGISFILDGISADEIETDGKVFLSINASENSSLSFFREGDIVSFSSSVRKVNRTSPTSDSYFFRNDIRYYSNIDESELSFVSSDAGLFQKMRGKIRSLLYSELGEYGAIAYGMIIGDKADIDDGVRNYYSASGLGHILAVSGLHIGFITLILSFITRKLKLGKKVDLIVHFFVLLFYCFLASFALSVIRASVMCIIGKIAYAFGKRRDGLNSLCFALSIILLFSPYSLFDVGFQMSASATLGIITLSKPIERLLDKFCPSFISKALALSLSAQIGIAPVVLYHFNTFPVYSVLTNVLVAPLITIGFISLTTALVLALIITPLKFLLSISAIPLVLLDDIAYIVSLLPFANLISYSITAVFVSLILYFVMSGYFMLPKFKWIVVSVCGVLCLTLFGVGNIPFDKKYEMVTYSAYKDVSVLIRGDKDGNILVGDIASYSEIEEMMTLSRTREIDAIYLTGVNTGTPDTVRKINEKFGETKVFIPANTSEGALYSMLKAGVDFYLISNADELSGGIDIVYEDGEFIGYTHTENDITTLILGHKTRVNKVSQSTINDCHIVRCYSFSGEYFDRIFISNYENSFIDELPENEIIVEDTPIAIDISSGKAKELVKN